MKIVSQILMLLSFVFVLHDKTFSCTPVFPANVTRALLEFLQRNPSSIIVGKVSSATSNTVVSTTERLTTFTIQFEIEKVISSPKTLPKVLVIRDATWSQILGTCFYSSKLASINPNNGQLSLNTNKFIVILDTATLPRVQSVWFDGYPILWTENAERSIDSLSKLAIRTNVMEEPTEKGFTVYPSPTQTRAMLKYFLHQAGQAQVEILNYQGQLLQSLALHCQAGENREEIDVSSFANGVYFCRIRHQNGIQMQRLVVQK